MAAAPPSVDLDIQKLVLDVPNRKVRGKDFRVDASLIDGSIERTMDGASNLTLVVHDPDQVLLNSGAFDYAIDARLDRLYWRLCKIAKQDTDLTLTFEDRIVSRLRQHSSPKKANRGPITRAEFALSLVREVRKTIPFVCPELHTSQAVAPIENSSQARTTTSRATQKQKGLNRQAKL